MSGNGRGGGRRVGRQALHEPSASGGEGPAARRADLAPAQQHLHAPLHPGLEGAVPRPALRRGDRQLRGRSRGLRPGPGRSHAGGGPVDDGTPAAAGQHTEDPLLARAGGTDGVSRVPRGMQLPPGHGAGSISARARARGPLVAHAARSASRRKRGTDGWRRARSWNA